MGATKWFDRSFDLSFGAERYKAIYDQLAGAPERLQQAVRGVREETLVDKPEGKWSIKEQAGHLFIMEPLWRTRFLDILEQKLALTVADLNNTATSEAGFNAEPIDELLARFVAERRQTIELLDRIDALDMQRTSLHPRLKQPMRVIDLAYFVAEHDEHHLAIVKQLCQ
ncbi:MAG TPA: DinB family protein [Puia sp.]|uniref:DinB family protein n=1 Tax=Puia sp. TaxID=2045100 RepID=UPI002CD5EB0C|nr:DinB family protein [Puia sp.]HVU98049.1 DinB family protein [Puia sp.]